MTKDGPNNTIGCIIKETGTDGYQKRVVFVFSLVLLRGYRKQIKYLFRFQEWYRIL